jgi:hypothetical protein
MVRISYPIFQGFNDVPNMIRSSFSTAIASSAHLLNGTNNDYSPLMEMIGNAHYVLLDEATHGTINSREMNFSMLSKMRGW